MFVWKCDRIILKNNDRKGRQRATTDQLKIAFVLLAECIQHRLVPSFYRKRPFHWPGSQFGLFLPFFAALRQILEHRDELALSSVDFYKEPHGKVSRIFVHSLLSSSFGSAGFTRHMIHHWDPQISYTRLDDIEAFLSRSDKTSALIRDSKTTYGSTLKKLLKAR